MATLLSQEVARLTAENEALRHRLGGPEAWRGTCLLEAERDDLRARLAAVERELDEEQESETRRLARALEDAAERAALRKERDEARAEVEKQKARAAYWRAAAVQEYEQGNYTLARHGIKGIEVLCQEALARADAAVERERARLNNVGGEP